MEAVLLLAVPPIVALGAIVTWVARPDRHRDAALRVTLIVTVCVTALEAMVGAMMLGFLYLLARSDFD